MNFRYLLKRIFKFGYDRRYELLDRALWKTVERVVRQRINIWGKVNNQTFVNNLAILEQRPWNIHVELTNLCNSNCIFCAYQYQKRPPLFMGDDVYDRVLDEYCRIGGGDYLLEVVVGDPALDPNFIQRIQKARKRKEINRIETITNAVAFQPKNIERVIKSGISKISISTAPLEQHLYGKIYRNRSYKKVLKNIGLLLKENEKAGCPVEIKLCFRSNLTMKKTLALTDYKMISQRGKHTVEFNADFDTWTGEITAGDLLAGMHLRPRSQLDQEPCIWFYDGPIVFANGNVGLCGCRDFNADSQLIIGNIMEKSLLELWQSRRVKDLRRSFYENQAPQICKKCTTYANLDLLRTTSGTRRAKLTQLRMKQSRHRQSYKSPCL